jgi:hypothetical protein
MKTVTTFQAFDGTAFTDEAECRAYEAARPEMMLVALTSADIAAAIDRSNADLADAIEMLGARLARERRAGGELKRTRKSNGAAEPTDEPAGVPQAPGASS